MGPRYCKSFDQKSGVKNFVGLSLQKGHASYCKKGKNIFPCFYKTPTQTENLSAISLVTITKCKIHPKTSNHETSQHKTSCPYGWFKLNLSDGYGIWPNAPRHRSLWNNYLKKTCGFLTKHSSQNTVSFNKMI